MTAASPILREGTVDVLFWVQHLLGIGHLTRAATLARALRRAGLRVTLVSGGLPVEGLELAGAELVQLEPVQSDGIDFKVLLDARGRPIDESFKARRRDHLLETFKRRRPRLVMLEMFPFGRRQMRFELLPLLDAIRVSRPRPPLVGSVRDILVRPPKPERLTEMLGWAEAFDRLLVHGDPDLVPFAHTFPDRDRLGERLIETGYVVEPAADELPAAGSGAGDGAGEIVVSTGGGRVGEQLLQIALEASAAMPAGPRWRLLVGQHLPEAGFRALASRAETHVTVERARPDFRALLAWAALSVSQGGYNTVMEVLAAGCRGVVVPYAGGLETEQTLRCALLAERGLLAVLDEATLDAATLVAAVQWQLAAPPKAAAARPRLDGALQTARLLSEMLVETAARNPS